MSEDWMLAIPGIESELKEIKLLLKAYLEGKQPHLEYTRVEETIEPIKKGKYSWLKVNDGGKPVRKCENKGCPYYLRYNEEKGTYEHGKYDPNTQNWVFVADYCQYFGGK